MLSVDQTSFRLDVEVRIEPDFDFLSPEYRAFYQPDRATAFQAPLWMDMIHRRLAPGLHAKQQTLTLRNRGNGALMALVPFVLQRTKGIRMMAPADFGVCDYNSIVGDRNMLAMIAGDPALVERIHSVLKGCDILMFRKVREDDFDFARLFPRSKHSPAENAAYHSEIGEDFDDWRRRTIRRKFSKEFGRLQRHAEREFGGYEHRPARSEAEICEAFELLREWRVGRFEGDLLQNPLYFDFYRGYALAGQASVEAITYVSYAGGRPVAVLFGLAGDGAFHAVLIGSDTERLRQAVAGHPDHLPGDQAALRRGFSQLRHGSRQHRLQIPFPRRGNAAAATTRKPSPWQDMPWRWSTTAPSR